jgi:hypothetical protein
MEVQLRVRNTVIDSLTARLQEASRRSWWDRYGFWVGMAGGLVVTVGVFFGTAKLLEAAGGP